jgi:hypothetical protein
VHARASYALSDPGAPGSARALRVRLPPLPLPLRREPVETTTVSMVSVRSQRCPNRSDETTAGQMAEEMEAAF